MATNRTKPEDEFETLRLLGELRRPIQEKLQGIRSEVRVTIGRAAKLTGLSEPKLRDLDKQGIVKPSRSNEQPDSQRQYSQPDLEKLAIIAILLEKGKRVQDIPANIDTLWNEVLSQKAAIQLEKQASDERSAQPENINQRIEAERKALFWRYYASHALRMALALIREDMLNTPIGLIFPVQRTLDPASVNGIDDLSKLGPSLVGWLSKSGSLHTLFTLDPAFQYSTDYDLVPLTIIKDDVIVKAALQPMYIILNRRDRRAHFLSLNELEVTTIYRLLAPLYENRQQLQQYFGPGVRDVLEPATLLNENYADYILDGLTDMIVQLGGQDTTGNSRWRFSCILIPEDSSLPLRKRGLVIRARSKYAPEEYKIGITSVSSATFANSMSLRAFRSGRVLHQDVSPSREPMIAYGEVEVEREHIRCAVAVPVGGEDGLPIGAFYVAAKGKKAFSEPDLRVLRLIGRMIEELLRTYTVRHTAIEGLRSLIDKPTIVDKSFQDFFSKNEFDIDIENTLTSVQSATLETVLKQDEQSISSPESDIKMKEEGMFSVFSFIAVDIDRHGRLAERYGDRLANNLSRAVGLRLSGQIRILFKKWRTCTLYHIHSDVFYIFLKDVSLEDAREKAELIRQDLSRPYQVDALHTSDMKSSYSDSIDLAEVTVRLGVTSYTAATLRGMLQQQPTDTAIAEISGVIISSLRQALADGWHEGGNCVMAWDAIAQRLVRWSPPLS